MNLLMWYDIFLKILIFSGGIIVSIYLTHQYRQYTYISKRKILFMLIGIGSYMGSLLINLIQLFFVPLYRTNIEAVAGTLEIIGIIFLATGFYQIMVELLTISNIDFLTNTYTNRYIHEVFENTKAISDRKQAVFSVVFIDIDNFKQINDQFGHEVGNKVLTEIATTLKETLREKDTIGRYGGDEFLIILHNTLFEEAELVLNRCRKAIYQKESIQQYHIGISGGVSTYPYDGDTLEQLSSTADMRMYQDKEKNKVDTYILT